MWPVKKSFRLIASGWQADDMVVLLCLSNITPPVCCRVSSSAPPTPPSCPPIHPPIVSCFVERQHAGWPVGRCDDPNFIMQWGHPLADSAETSRWDWQGRITLGPATILSYRSCFAWAPGSSQAQSMVGHGGLVLFITLCSCVRQVCSNRRAPPGWAGYVRL